MNFLPILEIAAWFVPASQREEWLAEWRAELWFAKRAHSAAARRFALGSFRDALWLRRNLAEPHSPRRFRLESPAQCMLFLAVVAACSAFFTLRMPLVRNAMAPPPYPDLQNLVILSSNGTVGPTVTTEKYQSFVGRHGHLFTGLAFYRIIPAQVSRSVKLAVAHASDNLFAVLDSQVDAAKPGSLVLSDAAWRRNFGCDPQLIGRILEVDGRRVPVSTILPAGAWRLPGSVDAWLLEDAQTVASSSPGAQGFVVGRYQPWAPHLQFGDFQPVALTVDLDRTVLRFVLVVAFACLLLPVTTSISLGDYPPSLHAPHLAIRLRRWMLLMLKVSFILLILFCAMVRLGYSQSPPVHGYLVACILAFRWALADQRERCPVCLRLLKNPARIGHASQTFLGWYGTEFACSRGHGLLHVPEIRTCSTGPQRWLYLDPSWSDLFT